MSYLANRKSKSRPNGLLSAGEVCSITGCNNRTLDHWIRVGLIAPEIRSSGTGSDNWFTDNDAVAVKLAVLLSSIDIETRREILKEFRATPTVSRLSVLIAPSVSICIELANIRFSI